MARSFPGCSLFSPRNSLSPDPVGGQIVQSPARTSVLYLIGIGGGGSWVKWLMIGGLSGNQQGTSRPAYRLQDAGSWHRLA